MLIWKVWVSVCTCVRACVGAAGLRCLVLGSRMRVYADVVCGVALKG